MTQAQADRLAEKVRRAAPGHVRVEREGHYFVVAVETPDRRVVLRDDVDWDWLRHHVLEDPS
jgi:DNA polymerase elongation subunit (family B)